MILLVTPNKNEGMLSVNDLYEDVFKKNKAILYLSTTADQDYTNDGISYSIFIQDDGTVKGFEMDGLELGSVALGKDSVFLEDKDTVHVIDNKIQTFEMDKNQYTGERTGYLKEKKLFFSLYNSGFTESGYRSDIRYGNKQGFRVSSVPFYIAASGMYEDQVIILTQDLETDSFHLKELQFNKNVEVIDLAKLEVATTGDMQVLAPILSDEAYYYLILSTIYNETEENVSIYRIHKETMVQESYTFIKYKDVDLTATIPYNYKNSASIYKDKIYYINGFGEVYTFNLQSFDIAKAFTIKNANQSKIRNNEETYFLNNLLYVLRYNKLKGEQYYLETYSLDTNELENVLYIKGLEDILLQAKSKSVYSYDLKVLQ